MVLKGKKWSQNFQYGLKKSSMFPNGPKWSFKIYHKFHRMAFTTRFNLVVVWSNIVQILTKKSSNWVRHNQVSWSSFFSSANCSQHTAYNKLHNGNITSHADTVQWTLESQLAGWLEMATNNQVTCRVIFL